MEAAKTDGTIVSYDLNYRASLWKIIGGKGKAQVPGGGFEPFALGIEGAVQGGAEPPRQIRALARGGFTDIVVNAAHLAGMLVDAIGDGARYGARVRWSIDVDPLDF